jgi:hypothetical protein
MRRPSWLVNLTNSVSSSTSSLLGSRLRSCTFDNPDLPIAGSAIDQSPRPPAIVIDEFHACGLEHAADGLIIDPGELVFALGGLGVTELEWALSGAARIR